MRVFFDVPFESRGIRRVALQLAMYLPEDIEIATDPRSADLTVIHVVGRHDHNVERAQDYVNLGHKYAVIQYVLNSCRNPDPEDWVDLWNGAKVVWSYYDLHKWCPTLYHAPLGVLSDKFYKKDVEKKYLVGTIGSEPNSECFNEVRLACFNAGGRMLHIGKKFAEDPIMDCVENVSDDELRYYYNQCKWFSSLRKDDGFEMPALEALLCGVRPIMFDTINYRQWYNNFAKFIPERTVGDTVRNLKKILVTEPDVVTNEEITEIKERFDWKTLVEGFWNRCRI